MKSKKLLFTLVFLLSFVLVLAISACAATITVHSGADATTASTTYNGSLTLPGNTEENDTVTVYFTDDGRAWKAGEVVSFTQNTTLYTIECTKIATYEDWKNATGGNYILVNHLDFNKATPKADGSGGEGSGAGVSGGPMKLTKGSTTRVFFNGYAIGSGNKIAFEGTDVSIYLLGSGVLNGYWLGHFMNLTFTADADSTIVLGKDIVAKCDWTQKHPFLNVNTFNANAKLDVHFYGSFSSGQVIKQNTNAGQGVYNVYFHDGCTVNLQSSANQGGGYLVSNATAPTANLVFEGGTFTFTRENLFVEGADLSQANVKITGGTFTFSYDTTKTQFENYIDAAYQPKAISNLSFSVICKECAFEKTLGDDFVDLQTEFTINNYCPNCKTMGESTKVSKVFTAKGYSVNPKGTVINAGFEVNLESLELYEEVVGKTTYGIVIANADTFNGKTFFNSQNKVNTDKSIQIDIERLYNHFSCSLNFGTSSNSTLNLVIAAYSINKSGVDFIQHSRGNAVDSSKIADGTFKSINLNMLVAEQPSATKEELL